MAGSLYPWFPVNKAKDMHNEPVETQFNNIGSAFQTDPSECDSEVGKRVRCLKKVAFLYSDKSCIGFNAGSVITFDQPE
jgi:hypothetical protein